MTTCNTKRVRKQEKNIIFSEIDVVDCEQNISNSDMIDFMTDMDNLSFYEKTAWNRCDDLIYVTNEEALWQTIVGEIKTPYGVLSNSIGQNEYGCLIWNYIGENIDSLDIKSIEYDVIDVCLRYPEVDNVIGIETYMSEENDALLMTLTIDSIYGTFDGHLRIPTAYISKKQWHK